MAMDDHNDQRRRLGPPPDAPQQQQQQQSDEEAPGVEPDRIDLDDEAAVAHWAKKLDVSPEQISEAVDAVGDLATDVEMHLKGTRSTTNADRLDELDDDA